MKILTKIKKQISMKIKIMIKLEILREGRPERTAVAVVVVAAIVKGSQIKATFNIMKVNKNKIRIIKLKRIKKMKMMIIPNFKRIYNIRNTNLLPIKIMKIKKEFKTTTRDYEFRQINNE